MRPLLLLLVAAAAPACMRGTGPTTDTDDTTTLSPTPATDDTLATTANPTTGAATTAGATSLDTTLGTTSTTSNPVDVTTTTAPDTTTLPDPSTTTAPGTTGPDEGALVIAIVDAELYADCKPRPAPDPVQGGWTVSFDNTQSASDTAATLVSATLSLADIDPPELEPILVTPTDSGPVPAGQQIDLPMDKLTGAMHSACAHCGEWYELVLTYDEGGTPHEAVEEVMISCAL